MRVVRNGNNHGVGALRRAIGTGATWVAERAGTTRGDSTATPPALTPLTPDFNPDQHQVYVDHLNAALQDDVIRNIALTGRYGAGKSSVLQEFARRNGDRVLFLSLSTLGPDAAEESQTNQIEKELVKQLLYREKPARLPQSRYQRIDRLPLRRSVLESAGGLIVLGIALWFFGVFPDLPGLAGDHPGWMGIGAAAVVVAAMICLLTWLRLAVHNRLAVSEVSAGGASISLAEPESYFDEYLDEIVYFFESMRQVDIVVFEDLDRFDDPGIFEALRELNTLLNNSKQTQGRVIRFVFALRDSIFEKLGHDTMNHDDDAALAETVRANRTKFFDMVIPIVPFITHRTSRDLLTQLVNNKLEPDLAVGPDLIDLTARHLPDMRLLTNIVNEYSVYAKRLITDKQGIAPLGTDKLFAMLVYKNIHLADFEYMQQGRSNLDIIYRLSRELVAESLAIRRTRLRRIADATALEESITHRAADWGTQLTWFFGKVAEQRSPRAPMDSYVIGDTTFSAEDVHTEKFWRTLFDDGNGVTVRIPHPQGSHLSPLNVTATKSDLQRLFGDQLLFDAWENMEHAALKREEKRLRADLAALRTADFSDLVTRTDFHLTDEGEPKTFEEILGKHIKSEVGRALITAGFIDRHYTLYVAQYYGDRVPPNAMTFLVHHVDTNNPDINYPLNDEDIEAVLRETKRSFLSDASAYNISILDHLLQRADPGADTILNSLITRAGEPEQKFLQAYLTEGTQAAEAVAELAVRWPAVFTHLIDKASLSTERRIELVDAALAHSSSDVDYDLGNSIREYFHSVYPSLPTLMAPRPDSDATPQADTGTETETPTDTQIHNAVTTMTRAGFVCDDLAALNLTALRTIVESDHYSLTAANLRTALGDPNTLSLDRIRALDPEIYKDILKRPSEYLRALADDTVSAVQALANREIPSSTAWTVEDPDTFTGIVTDLADYTKEQAVAVITLAHPDCRIDDLSTVPDTTWEALAHCHRFPATLSNIDAHIDHQGEIDADLADILTTVGTITVPTGDNAANDNDDSAMDELEETKARVAEAILSASNRIPDAATRVTLVRSMDPSDWISPVTIRPEQGSLLGLLIAEKICNDEIELFKRFDLTDWDTLRYAVLQSAKFAKFVTPELLNTDMTTQLLTGTDIPTKVKQSILDRFDEFIPRDNRSALSAAGQAALAARVPLSAERITSIASGTQDADLVVRLLHCFDGTLNTDQILASLLALPTPHNKLNTAREKLSFPVNDHHTAVLARLKKDGRITTRTYQKLGPRDARIDVTVK
ncbi:hypothetical protein ACFYRW_22305 [Rhodococcus pyridinivorans]|uniref:YobI family P-loop NTPase n=1 Tax=Rhodococcus pyridinivorans TaxID=103816 RepID=UPI0036CD940E